MPEQSILDPISFTLEVLTPLHIGMGDKLGRMSMVTDGKQLHIVDEDRLLQQVGQDTRRQSEFIRCAENSGRLDIFLKDYGIRVEDVSLYSEPIVGELPGNEVLPFIKAAGSRPHPYIPGSSLKGAVRGAFLRAALQSEPALLAQAQDKVREHIRRHGDAKRADDDIERLFFGQDQHHEWLRALHFRDTRNAPLDALAVMQVQTFSVGRTKELQPKNYSLHPEVLMPRKGIKGEAVIQTYLLGNTTRDVLNVQRARKWIPNFIQKCNEAAKGWIDHEIAFYTQYPLPELLQWYQERQIELNALLQDPAATACFLWIGWGSGYESQAIGNLFDDPLRSELRKEYVMGKVVHKGCNQRVSLAKKPEGNKRWRCKQCQMNISDGELILVLPFTKSRKLARTANGLYPLGWLKLHLT